MLFSAVLRFVTWLLVLGVFAGLGGRLLMGQGVQSVPCVEADHCCDTNDGHHEPSQDKHEDEHGPDCPPGPHHHHQGHCCSGGAMTAETGSRCSLAVLEEGRTLLSFGSEVPPDEPVFSLDKPPLI